MFNLYLVMFTLYVLLLLFMFLSLFLCAHIVMIFFKSTETCLTVPVTLVSCTIFLLYLYFIV